LAARAALTGVGELSYGRTNSRVPCDFSILFIHTPGRANTQRPLVRVNAYFRRSFCRAASSVLRALPRQANSRGSSTSVAGTGHLAATSTDDSRKAIFPQQASTDRIYLGLGFVPAFQPHPLSYRHTCTTHSNKLLLSATQQHLATAGCRLHRDTEHQGTHKPSFDRRHPFVNKKTANAQMWSLMNETNGANSSQGIDGTSEPKCCLQMDETNETNETNETK
jgi:hypothetical protein